MLRRSIQALLRASYINERTGGGRSRLRQCLVSVNPLEPALLHRWTSLKVKTFPHQGFVKENGCIFLEAIIFILLSVLESNPHKPSASGLTGLSVYCSRAGMELRTSTGNWLPPTAAFQPSMHGGLQKTFRHQRSKSREQGGYLAHSRGFEGTTVTHSYPALSAQACLSVLVWMLSLPPWRNTHPFVVHGYMYHSTS